jgi:hypothetical protein
LKVRLRQEFTRSVVFTIDLVLYYKIA